MVAILDMSFYSEPKYFETKGQFMIYLKGIVVGDGDDRQPVIQSIYKAQEV